MTVTALFSVSPVEVNVDSILKRKQETEGVVMEIFLFLIVITERKKINESKFGQKHF